LLVLSGYWQRKESIGSTALREIIPPQPSPLLYADHVAENDIDFFRLVCAMDLEGMLAKRAASAYEQPEHSPNWRRFGTRTTANTRAAMNCSTVAALAETASRRLLLVTQRSYWIKL
jgi:hypothetical protein